MHGKKLFLLLFLASLLAGALPAQARFPFSFRKQEIKTDYSQTVWDQIMREQSLSDMRRGMGEMTQARYQEASNSFAKAIVKNAQDPMAHLLYGASLYWAGKVDDAVTEYNEALRLSPKNSMAYQLLGIAAGWKGDVNLAQEYFLKANQLDPNKADTHMNLGSTYGVQRKLEKALEHFRQATELAPREPLYHYQLGTLYEAMGRDNQAEDSFRRALRLFSAYEDAQLSLGALYEKLNREEEALKFYKKAVKTKPGDYVARLRYALLLMRRGDEKTAREVVADAFSITRFKADGLALNAVYRANGNTAQAFENQIQKFKDSLAQVSPAKTINVEVALAFEPVEQPAPATGRTNTFEQAYERLRAGENHAGETRSFKRSFALQATDEPTRKQQIEDFISGVKAAVSQADGTQQVSLSLQGRTVDFASPTALTQNNTTAPKAVYDPRIVGNDMGLWVMGKTWLMFVDDAEEDLAEMVCPAGNLCDLLLGLAALSRGNAVAAQGAFERAAVLSSQDPLAWLGLGTSAVVAGEDAQANAYYKRALEVDPKNKIAERNLKNLAE